MEIKNQEFRNQISSIQKRLKEELAEYDNKEVIERQKYRESLKPISKDEFIKRFRKLFARYNNTLKTMQKLNIFYISADINLKNIILQAVNTTDGIELAELIDKAERRMTDIEEAVETVRENPIDFAKLAKYYNGYKIEEKIQKQIEKSK